jgi:hypothetical protein
MGSTRASIILPAQVSARLAEAGASPVDDATDMIHKLTWAHRWESVSVDSKEVEEGSTCMWYSIVVVECAACPEKCDHESRLFGTHFQRYSFSVDPTRAPTDTARFSLPRPRAFFFWSSVNDIIAIINIDFIGSPTIALR